MGRGRGTSPQRSCVLSSVGRWEGGGCSPPLPQQAPGLALGAPGSPRGRVPRGEGCSGWISRNRLVAVLVRNTCEDWGDVLSQRCSSRGLLRVPVERSLDLPPVPFDWFLTFWHPCALLLVWWQAGRMVGWTASGKPDMGLKPWMSFPGKVQACPCGAHFELFPSSSAYHSYLKLGLGLEVVLQK